MKTIGNCIIIYRVVGDHGPFVSYWVFEKKEAQKIMKNLKDTVIFSGDTYHIEESTLKI